MTNEEHSIELITVDQTAQAWGQLREQVRDANSAEKVTEDTIQSLRESVEILTKAKNEYRDAKARLERQLEGMGIALEQAKRRARALRIVLDQTIDYYAKHHTLEC